MYFWWWILLVELRLRISLSICVCWLGDCDCSPVTLLDCLLHPHKPSVLRFDRFCFCIPTPASQSPLLLCPPLHFPPSPPPPPRKTAGAVVSKTPRGGYTLAQPPRMLQGAALVWRTGSGEPALAFSFVFPTHRWYLVFQPHWAAPGSLEGWSMVLPVFTRTFPLAWGIFISPLLPVFFCSCTGWLLLSVQGPAHTLFPPGALVLDSGQNEVALSMPR